MTGPGTPDGTTAGRPTGPDALAGGWRHRIPLFLLYLSLAALIGISILVHRARVAFRANAVDVIEPAREASDDLRHALVRQIVSVRSYLLTGDSIFLRRHRAAAASESAARQKLEALFPRLEPGNGHLARVDSALDRWHRHITDFGLLARGGGTPAPLENLTQEQRLHEEAIAAAEELDAYLDGLWRHSLAWNQRLDRTETAVFALLSALALAATLALAWTVRGYRHLAGWLAEQAHREERFRRFASELVAEVEPGAITQRITEAAQDLIGADAAYLERVLPGGDRVEVVGSAGDGALPRGLRAPYPGTPAEHLVQRDEPALLCSPDDFGPVMRTELSTSCPGCTPVAVPLSSDGHHVGTLVLLLAPDRRPTLPASPRGMSILTDITALSLRRAILAEDAERHRAEIEASEERYRSLFTLSPEAVFEFDLEGNIVRANPAAQSLAGYEGRPDRPIRWESLVVPEDIERVRRHFEAAAAGKAQDFEVAIRRPDGEIRELDAAMSPIVIRDRIVGVFGVATDITERKRFEETRQRLIAILEAASDFVGIADSERQTLYVNRAGRRMIGVPDDEDLTGVPISAYFPPAEYERIVGEALPTAARTGSWAGESVLLHRNGAKIPVSAVITAHPGPGARVDFYSTIMRDISRTKEWERRIAEALAREQKARAEADARRREIERLMESKARLIRGFSHDLKNPIGAIDGYAQLLESGVKGELTPEQRDSIARIRKSARDVLDLIEDLLDLSRAEAGVLRLEPKWIDPAEIVGGPAEDHRGEAENVGLEFDVAVPDDLPRLHTDPDRARQILGNLLSNAIKYTPAEGSVRVRAETSSGDHTPGPGLWLAICVSDTGPGIPEDQQERIFEEFSRLEPHVERGAGLGLAISRRLARALGGDITVRSRPGVGSTFTLWLPIPSAPRAADAGDAAP